jgi:hypothetical protein
MRSEKIQTGIRFTEDMLLKITHIARSNHRSLNAQLEYLSQLCIEEFEAKKGEIVLTREDREKYRK